MEIASDIGAKPQPQKLSYDKIVKNTLAQSKELTIRFVNGLFGDKIPSGASVVWLDKETVNDKHVGLIADFYPRIDGNMYHIEVERDDRGDMAVRVFKYTLGGALLHNMTATDSELSVTFPKPCVVFLKSRESTPEELTWNLKFFDGQAVTLRVPAIRLADLSAEEIARRDLFPVGQFLLRTFDPVTKAKEDAFRETAADLMTELKSSVEAGRVPYPIALQMQDNIRATIDKAAEKSKMEVGFIMDTSFVETLPWIDYNEVLQRSKEEGINIGKAEGKAERDTEIALNAFRRARPGSTQTIEILRDLGISDDIINDARARAETERA